ncbi:MAG: hypothetical protein J7L47_01635 [Candidatus Odinarchaeota archaeon]|nr:hypothetical protein [Candidatus Odinarchaeota archaeon]
MIRYYLATVGEHTEPTIMRAMSRNGCDELYLFASEKSYNVAKKIVDTARDVLKIKKSEIKLVNPLDIWSTTIEILKTLVEIMDQIDKSEHKKAKITIDITGGTRIMTLAATLAAVKAGINPKYYLYRSETDEIFETEIPFVLVTHEGIGPKKEAILKSLYWYENEKGEQPPSYEIKTLSQIKKLVEYYRKFGLNKDFGKSISNYSEDTKFLADAGLIIKPEHPKRGKFKLTHAGTAFVDILRIGEELKEKRKKVERDKKIRY